MSPDISLGDRLAGAIWGHLVGDAVGVPYEFLDADEIGDVHLGAIGAHSQPAGTWSDDGAPMLALLDSLLEKGFDTTDQAERALSWRRDGKYAPGGKVFDIGNATRSALDAIVRGVPAEEAGPADEWSGGNGSLMRILPLALVERDTLSRELVDHAHRASRVTHGHPRPQVAGALYVLIARGLLVGGDDREHVLAEARAELRRLYGTDAFRPEYLAALYHLEGWSERKGRGLVWDSFWSAWDAFAKADSYQEAIVSAISYGHDTDTTAAICAGLAGIYWGIDGVPAEWLAGMRAKEIVEPMLAKRAESGAK